MEYFIDQNGNRVALSFNEEGFEMEPRHVLVLCKKGDDWLLTNHKERGWEFPGGKAEEGEDIYTAAKREVKEETGAVLSSIEHIGTYQVMEKHRSFIKAIMFAEVDYLQKVDHYFETDGPKWVAINQLMREIHQPNYSFIMKDRVVERSVAYLQNRLK
ncbi:RNA deprotection pyrophosphohydrolase [Cytobacillus sp. FSL W7-1323]|uniref:Nucleoside triphosphatase YtkD n=1 Tax=Cytobacillus kochii TaxID=859143 RepID=A0A248TKD3_9BACI|nr:MULTISPECIES: nucleoside triphosphatase YtkD [Cytobacillus]ASV68589.1 nucleoside triphosphatase YtkD [Cytobacillus kochii]MDM5208916.1 nucleoside triphosphatase YtkD [Cytobacillus kochii]MEA1855178.1 nucleoside triphosphatase YtkD [Cytobacillus sp. OWB-43]MED1605947.1 nucleoside triphosphatase YtkD [Cytobacillus kochii]